MELDCQARLHTPFAKDPLCILTGTGMFEALSKCIWMELENMSSFISYRPGGCGQLLQFMLVSLDPGGAKKSGMKAKGGHVPSRFPLRHLASIITHCLQGKDGNLIYTPGILLVVQKTLLPSVIKPSVPQRPHVAEAVFTPNMLLAFPPSSLFPSFPPSLFLSFLPPVLDELQGY